MSKILTIKTQVMIIADLLTRAESKQKPVQLKKIILLA